MHMKLIGKPTWFGRKLGWLQPEAIEWASGSTRTSNYSLIKQDRIGLATRSKDMQ